MIQATKIDIVAILTLLILISLGLFGFTYFMITSALIFLVLYTTNKSTAGVFLIWFFFNLAGIWSTIFKIKMGGLIFFGIGLILFYFSTYNHKINFFKSVERFLPIFLFFFVFYALGPMHSYSNEKMIFIVYKGMFYLICFSVLLLNPTINYIKLIVLILLATYQYYSYVNISLYWPGPSSFIDFGSYRSYYMKSPEKIKDQLINYQEIGLLAVIAFGFLLNLIPTKKSTLINTIFFFIALVVSLLLILYSGSRQSLYSLPFLFFAFIFFNKKIEYITKIKYLVTSLIFTFLLVNIVYTEDSVFKESKGTTLAENINRPFEILHAINLIEEKPLLGHGLGGFTPFNNNARYYPHNIFLELISETGFIGTLLLLTYMIILAKMNKLSFKKKSNSGFLIVPIFLALFMRANLSSDLIETVYIFSFLIAWISIRQFNKSLKT